MFKIITTKRYKELRTKEVLYSALEKDWREELEARATTYNCGAKGCQFQTTSPNGLSIHRAKAHK